jgi:hypothetical protein
MEYPNPGCCIQRKRNVSLDNLISKITESFLKDTNPRVTPRIVGSEEKDAHPTLRLTQGRPRFVGDWIARRDRPGAR